MPKYYEEIEVCIVINCIFLMNVLINNLNIDLMVFRRTIKLTLPYGCFGIAIRCSALLGFLEYQYILKKMLLALLSNFPDECPISFHLCLLEIRQLRPAFTLYQWHFQDLYPPSGQNHASEP